MRSELMRGLPARAGSLRRFQADSGAGSARDEKAAGGRYVKDIYDLQDFYGSDGTRTRDLRRDRPVLVFPGWAEVGGDSGREQGFQAPSCGDSRASAGAPGRLLQDERGMKRCLNGEQAGWMGSRHG